jgi:anti-sigma regulatory factor (Ser/Thr protein kinase)
MHTVKFPLLITIRNANCIIQRCENAISSGEKEVLFDFSTCAFSDPFAVTLLVGAMKACAAKGHEVIYASSENKKLDNYFKGIGFYEFGARAIDRSRFSDQQVELKHLKAVDPTYTDAVIQVLQGILRMSKGVRASLHLSINELLTNTFDHSGDIEGCLVCAQAYTARGNVNICLTDFGKGILKSLSSAPEYSYLNDSIDAIELAIQEGVTSRVGKLAGLGLTHIHRFLKVNEGEVHIISGDGWVYWNYKNGNNVTPKRKRLAIAFEGTIVNIIARADGEGLYFLTSENPEEQIF